jgi:hypothetical protein
MKTKVFEEAPHGEGYLSCPLAEGKYLLQSYAEVEGEKDELKK